MRPERDNEGATGTPPQERGDTQEIERQIDEHTKRLGCLFEKVNEISQQRIWIIAEIKSAKGREAYELLRGRLEARRAEIDAISEQIERLVAEVDALYERLRAYQKGARQRKVDTSATTRAEPEDEVDEEIILRRRLGHIADAQNEAVCQWNANPAEVERSAFEAKLQRLYEEYNEVLAQLNAARAAKSKGGFSS